MTSLIVLINSLNLFIYSIWVIRIRTEFNVGSLICSYNTKEFQFSILNFSFFRNVWQELCWINFPEAR